MGKTHNEHHGLQYDGNGLPLISPTDGDDNSAWAYLRLTCDDCHERVRALHAVGLEAMRFAQNSPSYDLIATLHEVISVLNPFCIQRRVILRNLLNAPPIVMIGAISYAKTVLFALMDYLIFSTGSWRMGILSSTLQTKEDLYTFQLSVLLSTHLVSRAIEEQPCSTIDEALTNLNFPQSFMSYLNAHHIIVSSVYRTQDLMRISFELTRELRT